MRFFLKSHRPDPSIKISALTFHGPDALECSMSPVDTTVMETHEGLNPDLSVEMEDNSIGKESHHSRPDYNQPEMVHLSN
jgi:hypothetical protein